MKLLQYEKEHLRYVKATASEGTLFLRKNKDFPLDEPCPIAAYGNGIRHTVKGGTGSGEVNSRFSINVERGLTKAGFTITTDDWLDAYDECLKENEEHFISDIKAEAKEKHQNAMIFAMGRVMCEPEHDLEVSGEGDTAVYVLSRISGEGNDRRPEKGDVKLSDSEVRTILECNRKYKKFLLVLNVGGAIDLSEIDEVENILLLSQLGAVTGKVLTDIMLGKANPSGKLTTTWAKWEDYPEIGDFGDSNNTRYKEGIYVGYRYFDTVGKKAAYPFGFGLSYTEFSIKDLKAFAEGEKINVSASVTNIGQMTGKEVLQVYVSSPDGILDKPYQELAGFAKTKKLAPGESETLTVSFSLSDLASYDQKTASYILDAGKYIIRAGNSCADTAIVAAAELKETVTVRQCRNCLGEPDFEDYKPEKKQEQVIPAGIKTFTIDKDAFSCIETEYDRDYEVDEDIEKLTDEELAYMEIGSFNPKGGIQSIIGEASTHVAGAAGETTGVCEKYGIKPMIMSDGPAGLRLSKNYYEDKNGAHGMGAALPESVEVFLPGAVKTALRLISKIKVPRGAEIKHQYATSIPIGTAVAQTFNYEVAKKYGDIVGAEMEMFNVDLWLAPALNIHRSILCGRNFEYYSEDPLVSGLMAAAITEGVQKHPGCGTTIKHYAANNAETNRYHNNSQVSERAMREIYLRGFGIAVRKSQPRAVMTSYNLLNGIHTSERRGLIEDILRCEYGFEGIVMTDWVLAMMDDKESTYRSAWSSEVAKAGGDLFMPGSQRDFQLVLDALKDGSLSRRQLEINATRVAQMSKKLH